MSSLNKHTAKPAHPAAARWHAIVNGGRVRRGAIVLLIVLSLFGLVGFFAAPPLIRHVGESQLSKQLGRPVSIGRVTLNPYTLRFEADRVRIAEPDGMGAFASVERLVLQASWMSLLRVAPIIRQLKIDSLQLHVVRTAPQRFNFSDLLDKFATPPGTATKQPLRFSIANIQLENGRIDVDDRVLGARHTVDQLAIGVPFVATLGSRSELFVTPQLHARIDGSPLSIIGKTKPFAASRESDVALRFDQIDVPQLLSYVPARLPVDITGGKLSTDLQVRFALADAGPTVVVSGVADLAGLSVKARDGTRLADAARLHLNATAIEPLRDRYEFAEIALDKPTVALKRLADGNLDVVKLFTAGSPPVPSTGSAAPTVSNQAAKPVAKPVAKPGAQQAVPFDLILHKVTIADGVVSFEDRVSARPVVTRLTGLNASLGEFSLRDRKPAAFKLRTRLAQGGSVSLDGVASVVAQHADVRVGLDGLTLTGWQPYLESVFTGRLMRGTLATHFPVTADWSGTTPAIKIGNGDLSLDGVAIAVPAVHPHTQAARQATRLATQQATQQSAGSNAREGELATAPGPIVIEHVLTKFAAIDVAARTVAVDSVEASGLAVDVARNKDGSIDLASLVAPPASSTPSGAAPWHYRVGRVALAQSSIGFVDRAAPRPVAVKITGLRLDLRDLSDDWGKPWRVATAGTLNGKGTFDISGTTTLKPLTAALTVDANRLDVAAFAPYFDDALNARIASTLFSSKGELKFAQTSSGPRVHYDGNASLLDVRLVDESTSDRFAGWRTLSATQMRVVYDPRHTDVDARRVALDTFYGRVFLDAQGRLNLADVVRGNAQPQSLTRADRAATGTTNGATTGPTAGATNGATNGAINGTDGATAGGPTTSPAPTLDTARASMSKRTVDVHVGEFALSKGRITYTDNFVKPNFTANLVGIAGRVGAFSTQSAQPAQFDVKANLAANGPVAIKGEVNPLAAKPSLDLTATANEIQLTNLTPYSTKYAGFPITKGKLNVDLHYILKNDQLSANNHLFIDQLTFGDHVDSPTATKLPVRLAIALLKNSRGEIDVNVPVSGSLSDPQFSLGSLIWGAVANLLQKAVTAPFALLTSAFGSEDAQQLGYVEFAPGSAQLTDASRQKLETLSKALNDKPQVKVDLIGRVDPKLDEAALRTAYVDRLVRQQKVRDLAANGASVDPRSVTAVTPDEYGKYVTMAYKDSDVKKERNLIGMVKAQPPEQLTAILAAHAPINESSLRDLAQRRAAVVQQWFDGKVDAGRIYTVAPKLTAEGIQDKGATTRVDFGVK